MRIVLADSRKKRIEQVRRILLGAGLTCESDDVVDYDGLPTRLAGVEADLVMVACDETREEALAAIRAAHQLTDVPILAAGQKANVAQIQEAMRAGAGEFLDIGRLREELAETLIKMEARGEVAGPRGKVISLFSPNGGVGVSTAAVNLAVELGSQMPDQVALVDLKPAPSDLALMMDIQPEHTLDEVCAAWQRLDRRMLKGAMLRHRSGVQVLAQAGYGPNGSIPEKKIHPEAVGQLYTLLRRSFAVSVVDLAHTLDNEQITAMRLSDFVGLLVRLDVPGLRRARWALDAAVAKGVPRARFRLVLSRFGQGGQVDTDKVEEILGIQVFQTIPEDYQAVNRAVNQGVPLSELSKRSRINRSFSSFARSVQASSGSGKA